MGLRFNEIPLPQMKDVRSMRTCDGAPDPILDIKEGFPEEKN